MRLEPILGQTHPQVGVQGRVGWIRHSRWWLRLLLQVLVRHGAAARRDMRHASSAHALSTLATQLLLLHGCTCSTTHEYQPSLAVRNSRRLNTTWKKTNSSHTYLGMMLLAPVLVASCQGEGVHTSRVTLHMHVLL